MNIDQIFKDAQNDSSLLSKIDINELLNSLENKNNDYLENKTLTDINNDKYTALSQINLSKENVQQYCEKLAEFRLVDEVYELHKGKYVRWINIEDDANHKLQSGGFVFDIKFLDNGVHVLCMNNSRRFVQYKFDNCLTFQKLSMEEQLILMAYEKI
jgi:hypothetical protein